LFGVVPNFRIGIHGGDVVVSEQGDTKRSIGIYGDAINIAARMEDAAAVHGVRCILSEVVAEALVNGERIREIGEEVVRGSPPRCVFVSTDRASIRSLTNPSCSCLNCRISPLGSFTDMTRPPRRVVDASIS